MQCTSNASVWLFANIVLAMVCANIMAEETVQTHAKDLHAPRWKAFNLRDRFAKKGAKEYASTQHGRPWDFEKDGDLCGIVATPGLKNVKVSGGILSFELEKAKGALYWGNWKGKGAPENFSQQYRCLRLRLRQSKGGHVRLLLYRDGALCEKKNVWPASKRARVPSGKWREAVFYTAFLAKRKHMMNAEAMGLHFEGKGNKVEIDWISATDDRLVACFRKTVRFDKPPLLAVANISPDVIFRVNGACLNKPIHELIYYGTPSKTYSQRIDFTKALQAGENVLSLELNYALLAPANSQKVPWVYLQAGVIDVAGNYHEIISDNGWKVSATPEKDWTRPGFDDSKWKNAKSSSTPVIISGNPPPAARGLIQVINRLDSIPAFDEDQGLDVEVRVPASMSQKNVRWKIIGFLTKHLHRKGVLDRRTTSGAWSVLILNCKGLPPGPYRLLLDTGDKEHEQRDYEFIIVGKISQPTTDDSSYTSGMKLRTVDMVRCGDQNDKHEFMTDNSISPSRITHSPIGSYRETGLKREECWFSYAISVPEPYRFYLITLDYPEDAERYIALDIIAENTNTYGKMSIAQVSPALWMGVQWPLSHTMKQFRFLYWAPARRFALNVVNGHTGTRAAVAKIQVDLVEELPRLAVNPTAKRIIGPATERTNIVATTMGAMPGTPLYELSRGAALNSWQYTQWYTPIANLIKYLRFCGYNAYFAGMYMYTAPHTIYPSPYSDDGSKTPSTNYFALMAKMFRKNNLSLYAYLKIMTNVGKQYEIAPNTNYEVRRGAPSNALIDAKGNQFSAFKNRLVTPNPVTKVGMGVYRGIIQELLDRYAKYPAFKGIMMANADGLGLNFRKNLGYGDATAELFEKETGTRIPVQKTDVDRFAKRAEWLKKNAAKTWNTWRYQKSMELNMEIYNLVRSTRNDLKYIVYNLSRTYKGLGENPIEDVVHACAGTYLRMPVKPGLISGITYNQTLSNRNRQTGSFIFGWEPVEKAWNSRELVSFFAKPTGCAAFLRCGFDELHYKTVVPKGKTWLWQKRAYVANYDVPAGDKFLEAYARILRKFNPELIATGEMDCQFYAGHEEEIRRFNQAFLAIPAGSSDDVPTGTTTEALRQMRRGGRTYFYLINLHWWHADATVMGADGKPVLVTDLIDGKEKLLLKLRLAPYAVRPFVLKADSNLVAKLVPNAESRMFLGQRAGSISKAYDIVCEYGYATPGQKALLTAVRDAYARKDYGAVDRLVYSFEAYVLMQMEQQCGMYSKTVRRKNDFDAIKVLSDPSVKPPDTIVIPKAHRRIRVDGCLDEWDRSSFLAFNSKDQNIMPAWEGLNDLSGLVYLRWDEEALYLGAEIMDDNMTPWRARYNVTQICQADEIELFFSTATVEGPNPYHRRIGPDASQIFLMLSSTQTPPRIEICLGRGILGGQKMAMTRRADGQGYTVEAKLPWKTIFCGFTPEAGKTIKMNMALSDTDCNQLGEDPGGKKNWMSLNGAQKLHRSTQQWLKAEFRE